MFSGTDTLDTSSLVEVATKYLWFTLLSGQPLSLWGPVTRRRPVPSCFRTTTRLPLWTPARTMATVPGVREEEEEASAQLLQDNDALAFVDSSEDDGDGSRGEGSPDLPHVAGEEVLGGAGGGGVNSGDVVGQLLDADHAGF